MKTAIRPLIILGMIAVALHCKSTASYKLYLVEEDQIGFTPSTFLQVKESITEVRPHTSDSFIHIDPFAQLIHKPGKPRTMAYLGPDQSRSIKGEISDSIRYRLDQKNLSAAKFKQCLGILRINFTEEYYLVDLFNWVPFGPTYMLAERTIWIAETDLIIRSFVILDELIYYAGVSISKGTIVFCKKKHRENEDVMIPVCYTIESENKISHEEYETVDVQVSAFKNKADRSIIIIYVKNSRDENFQSTFFLFMNEEFRSLKIPVEEFIIGKVQIVNYNFDRDIINALVLNTKSGYSDLIELRISHGYLDVGALRKGLIKSHVQNFDSSSQTIAIYEYDNTDFRVRILLLNVSNMEYQTLYIPKQKKIIKTEFAGNFVLIQTMNVDYVNELYILDIETKTLYKNKSVIIRMTDIWYLVADDQSHMLYIFKGDSFDIQVYEINTLMFDKFRVKEYVDQKKGFVTYYREDEKMLNFQITPVQFKYSKAPSHSEITFNPRYETLRKEDIFGNDVNVISSDLLYLQEVKIDYDPSQFNDCTISRFMFNDKYSIYICQNKKLIMINESFWNGLSMTEIKLHYQFHFQYFDTNEIKGFRYFFNDYLVILLNSGEMRILKLDVIDLNIPYEEKYFVNTDLVDKCDNSNYSYQGVICEEDEKYVFYSLNVDNGRFFVEKLVEIHKDKVFKKLIFNSYYRANSIYTFYQHSKANQFSLIIYQGNFVESKFANFPFENEINDDVEIHYLGFSALLFILNKKDRLNLYVLHRFSYLKMPFDGFITDYKDFIKVVSSQNDGYFFIIYRSTTNQIKAIAYKIIFDGRKRLGKSFVLDENNCNEISFAYKVHARKGFAFYYSCSDKESTSKLKVWEFLPNGPYIVLDKGKRYVELEFNKNKITYKLNPIVLTKNPVLKFSDYLVREKSDKEGYLELLLEKEKIIQLKGGIRTISIAPKINGIEFIDRIHLIKEEELISDLNTLKPTMRAEIEIVDENPFFNFGSYMYSQKRLEQNNNFFACQKIRVTYAELEYEDDLRLLYLCRNRRSFSYYITDLSHITIKLDSRFMEPNQAYERPFLINVKNFLYFFVTYKGSMVLRGIKIDYARSSSVLLFSHAFNLDPYPHRRSYLSTYFIFYQESSNSIILIMHNGNSGSIQFKKLIIQEFAFDVSNDFSLSFYESTKVIFDKIWYFKRKSRTLGFLGVSNFYIYEVRLYQQGGWKYKIESKYINYLTDSEHEVIMDQNSDYFGIMNFRSEQRPNIYIYEKDRFTATNHLFYVIDRYNLSTKNYHILNYAFIKNGTTKVSSIVVIYLEQILRDGITYKYLRSKQFEISQFKLRLRPQMLSYNQKITFEVEHLDQEESREMIEQYTIQLIINENLGLFALKILSTVAACAFIALNITVCFVFSSNQKLQEEIDYIKQLQQQGDVAPILNNQEQR